MKDCCYSYDEFKKYEFTMWKYLEQQERKRNYHVIYVRSVYKNKKIISYHCDFGVGNFSRVWGVS